MLAAHKFIDALLGKDPGVGLHPTRGVPDAARYDCARKIWTAQKFDFGELMLERLPDSTWAIPRITAEEMGFWQQGLIPLPFPLCWYEFVLGKFRSALLVHESGTRWEVQRLDLVDQAVLFDNIQSTVDRAEVHVGHDFEIHIQGNVALFNALGKHHDLYIKSDVGASMPLAIYLTLMLNSRSTEVRRAPTPSAKLNAARARRGRTPLTDHRVVRIVPEHFQYEHHPVTGHRLRRSPRLHWRRSHLRHYTDGNTVVIARMLVSRAALGEVSHEYRIDHLTSKETA